MRVGKKSKVRKLVILSIAALMCLGALAVLPSASAATTRFADGFESYFAGGSVFPPTGWTIYNVDGGDPWVAYSGSAHTGTYSARCYYDLPNNDWLVSKAITMPASPVQFSVWIKGSSYTAESYEIRYATTGNTVTDFTSGTLLFSGNAGSTWLQSSLYTISESAGTTVWFAIHYTGNNQLYLWADDFTFPDGSTQGFETVLPESWGPWTEQQVSGTSTYNNWLGATSSTSPTASPTEGTLMAKFYAYMAPSGQSSRLYTTTPLNFASWAPDTIIKLYFDMYLSSATGAGKIDVEIDTGSGWTTVATYPRYSATNGWVTYTVDLSSYATQTSVKFGFLATSDYNANDYIDKVVLTSLAPALGPVHNIELGTSYPTIQAAINDPLTLNGHHITVDPGIYSENAANWVDIDVYKELTITGLGGSAGTIVQLHERNNPAGAHMDGVSISASNVKIQGFTFTKQPTSPYACGFNIRAGINVHTPPPGNTFNNIILQDVVSEYSYGSNVVFDGAYTYNNVQLIDCNIHHSYTERCFYQSPNTIINGFIITNSHFDNAGYGIPTSGQPIGFNLQGTTTNLQITGGTFNDNQNGGIAIRHTTNAIIQGVSVVHSGYHSSGTLSGIGIWEDVSSTSNVQIINPTVTNSGGRGIMFGTWGKTVQDITVTGGTISGSGNIGCMLYSGGAGGLVTDITYTGVTVTNSGSHNFLPMEDDSSGDCTCSNVIITECTITNAPVGVYFSGINVAGSHVNQNNIVDNTDGVFNIGGTGILDALCNWWDDISGPSGVGSGTGQTVGTNVDYCPWLDDQYPDGNCGGGGYIMCDIQGPFTTGPKDDYFVHLCGHCSYVNICGDITTGTSYLWDWGDGTTSTTQCADHTYDPDCPDEGGFVTYFVTFTIKYQADGFDLSCSDSAIVTVYCSDNDPPITQLIYPTGGETLSGTETVSWFALDTELLSDLPIRLYYSPAGVNTWMPIGGVLYNNIDESHGSYNWNTNTLSDGSYKLKVVAQDNYYNIAESESKAFTINNDYANARVSSIQITDTSINSDSWVKDGDTIEITAGITGGSRLNRMDITADLSGFGKTSSVVADNYDGYVASWVVADVTCTPSDGPIQVAVTTDGDTNTGMITADNTVPVINLVKPTPGLYLFNTRLFPMSRTVIIGPITIVVDAVDISMAEFYVDVLDGHPEGYIIQAPFSWTMNYKLQGLHTVKIRLIDFAGNMNEQSLDLFIHNARGKPLN